jgi:hypothetical protein
VRIKANCDVVRFNGSERRGLHRSRKDNASLQIDAVALFPSALTAAPMAFACQIG